MGIRATYSDVSVDLQLNHDENCQPKLDFELSILGDRKGHFGSLGEMVSKAPIHRSRILEACKTLLVKIPPSSRHREMLKREVTGADNVLVYQ